MYLKLSVLGYLVMWAKLQNCSTHLFLGFVSFAQC